MAYFKVYELKEVMRQSSDPGFSKLLKRLREGKEADEDIE